MLHENVGYIEEKLMVTVTPVETEFLILTLKVHPLSGSYIIKVMCMQNTLKESFTAQKS